MTEMDDAISKHDSDQRTLSQEQDGHHQSAGGEPVASGGEKHKWDEYLLSILSKPTAQWIVTQRTDQSSKRYKVSVILTIVSSDKAQLGRGEF